MITLQKYEAEAEKVELEFSEGDLVEWRGIRGQIEIAVEDWKGITKFQIHFEEEQRGFGHGIRVPAQEIKFLSHGELPEFKGTGILSQDSIDFLNR